MVLKLTFILNLYLKNHENKKYKIFLIIIMIQNYTAQILIFYHYFDAMKINVINEHFLMFYLKKLYIITFIKANIFSKSVSCIKNY